MLKCILDGQWMLRGMKEETPFSIDEVSALFTTQEGQFGPYEIPAMPMQALDVLLHHGVVKNPNIQGQAYDIQWISDTRWVYKTSFKKPVEQDETTLVLKGVDLFADVYVNGTYLGRCEDAYIAWEFDVTSVMKDENELVVVVHPPRPILEQIKVPDAMNPYIRLEARARTHSTGFEDYLGPYPMLIHMGIYDHVQLEGYSHCGIAYTNFEQSFSENLDCAEVTIDVDCVGDTTDCVLIGCITDQEGNIVDRAVIPAQDKMLHLTVEQPKLWWPRLLGSQPLYHVTVELQRNDKQLDFESKTIGLREVKMVGDFDFRVNGRPYKPWGGNLAPLDTVSSCYREEKMNDLLDLAELGNFNCLRVWGSDERLDDAFYDECDRRGIMLWQDFYATYTMYDDSNPRVVELFGKEAEYQVKRLKHRPSILLWCGGNESVLARDFNEPGKYFWGSRIITEEMPRMCYKYDPNRYYHPSSPYGGAYANDPLGGDTHGYTHVWYVPGREYPVFLSENCRVSTPALRTLKRMMDPQDLWPEGYTGHVLKNSEQTWPIEWNKYNSNFGYIKLGDIERYYEANDIDSLQYRIGWGHGYYIRDRVERYRRGYPIEQKEIGERITKGHLLWKFNTSCNHIFFGVVDYFNEPSIAYYALKRSYEPVLLSFDVGNFINVWITNDSDRDLSGRIYIQLFDPINNVVHDSFDVPFEAKIDQSIPVVDLNRFGQFLNNYILYGYVVDDDGNRLTESVDYCQIERLMRFPEDVHIDMQLDGDTLVLTTDRYARSVELLGFGEDGDEFGWIFEDNYFDMIPGQVKRVRIMKGKEAGEITAKGYYAKETSRISYHA